MILQSQGREREGEGRGRERKEEFDAAFLRIPGPSIHASLSPHGPLIKDMKRDTMAHTHTHTHSHTHAHRFTHTHTCTHIHTHTQRHMHARARTHTLHSVTCSWSGVPSVFSFLVFSRCLSSCPPPDDLLSNSPPLDGSVLDGCCVCILSLRFRAMHLF